MSPLALVSSDVCLGLGLLLLWIATACVADTRTLWSALRLAAQPRPSPALPPWVGVLALCGGLLIAVGILVP